MEWLSEHLIMIATVMAAASSYVIYGLESRRERAKQEEQREAARALPEAKLRQHQQEQALEMLIHVTQMERRFETIYEAFPELTAEEVRLLLREVGGQTLTRKDGSEWWHHRSRRLEIINRHRVRKGRPLYAPPEARAL
jgi:D-alanyl-D-alanine dipeptidase